jgi:hypothetical protein
MEIFKLTDANMQTHGGFQWTLGTTYETDGRGALCGSGWLHAYAHPLLAVLLNPIHASFPAATMRLFRGVAEGKIKHDNGLKLGATQMRLVEEIPVPVVTPAQAARFAQFCADYAKDAATGPRQSAEKIGATLARLAEEAVK